MSKLNILIVEDESLVALELTNTLKLLGYNVVDYATSSQMAMKFMEIYDVNLILMDINLNEDINGIELYQNFKTEIPVIYTTAYKDDKTVSHAVSTNPLGYLIKPHNTDDLNVLLKLAEHKIETQNSELQKDNELIELGKGYFFHSKDSKLFLNNEFVKLTLKELQLLKLLIKSRGKIVNYAMIEKEVWNGEEASATSLRTLIYRLRNKMDHSLIESEFNIGIKLKELD